MLRAWYDQVVFYCMRELVETMDVFFLVFN